MPDFKTAVGLMTAMPPTKGHVDYLRFLNQFDEAHVFLNTQPDEPFPFERSEAVEDIIFEERLDNTILHWINEPLPQSPEDWIKRGYGDTPSGFWDMWVALIEKHAVSKGDIDYVVSSEMYGKELSEYLGAEFMPYDLDRKIRYSKATDVRNHPDRNFSWIAPQFQRRVLSTVTVFGAESTGKTTLSDELSWTVSGWWIHEFARPYLECLDDQSLNTEKMTNIWIGQAALQRQAKGFIDKPVIIQDTDLFSTIGYWRLHEDEYGPVPDGLIADAKDLQSDLYIMTRSNIPFEEDPIRYGGDKREGSDEFWESLAHEFNLPLVILDASDFITRIAISELSIKSLLSHRLGSLYYKRIL